MSRNETNSRVKDLWDFACLARRFAFDGETLRTAIAETFRRRGTAFTGEGPAALLPGYLNRHFYEYRPPRPLEEIEADIQQVERETIAMLREMAG